MRAGLALVRGDIVVICMADGSDDAEDVVRYVRKIEEGCDCVFGSRFIDGARVVNYPPVKRVLNRLGDRGMQLLFWTDFNDLSNAFKAYRTRVIRECGPFASEPFRSDLGNRTRRRDGALRDRADPDRVEGQNGRPLQAPFAAHEHSIPGCGCHLVHAAVETSSRESMIEERRADRRSPLLRVVCRCCLYGAIAASGIRAVGYLCYVAWHFGFPFETHVLEATMVHHAWRVMNGSAWYPAWTSYPHVTNFFTPFTSGSLARWVGPPGRVFLIYL